ncbi:hypothetical protein SAMN02745133_03155 [Desulforamulus putei DSM 12395]|uniref:Uncharacterized protein n=1 Tax=Desulforamulus putei DSM 12395 TaxID=1121429 RepID=A0A1M5DB38_9FIRM|nr:hypothetical protein [Desulforamulus putei]SHF64207.1 hypothetical protein SAMN02745133_03155 [Desulforamulus putei DSM 12395]
MKKKNITLSYLKIYFDSVVQRAKEMRPYIEYGVTDIPLDLLVWVIYLIYFIASLMKSWSIGWAAKPIEKALNVGGWFIAIQLSIIAILMLFIIWKDLADERRNNRPQSPITLKEIIKREIDFERWC